MKHAYHALLHGTALTLLSACCSTLLAGSQPQAPDLAAGYMPGAKPRWLGPADSKKAALLVHGFLGCGENFGGLPEALAADGWRVRVMLTPGHGRRPRDIVGVTAEEWAAAVQHEYDDLRVAYPTVLIAGHSLGGALATLTAAKAEPPPDGLVLAAPYFGVAHRWWHGLRPETWLALARPVLPWTYKGKLFMQVNRSEAKEVVQSYAWAPTSAMAEVMRVGRWVNEPEILSRVACPILWIHAREDRAAAYDAAEAAVDAMPGSVSRRELERSNHLIFHDYERDVVIEAILNFARAVAP